MEPNRIRLLLALTLQACEFPDALRASLAWRAWTQLFARYPLAGCMVTGSDGKPRLIAVGLQ